MGLLYLYERKELVSMNSISEQLLQAVDIVVDQKISQLKYDKTVQAIIYRIDDIDTGEYKVRYNGNIFTAYAEDITQSYKLDERIYVTIPEGDFSNRKLITGKATIQSLNNNQILSLQNSFFEISNTFDKLYNNIYDPNAESGVCVGAQFNENYFEEYIYQGPDSYSSTDYHGLFQQYASQYELIRVKASFLTQFYQQHDKGNYGLEIVFYGKENTDISYRLDLNAFNGDPYRLSVYSPQEIIFKTQKNYLLGLKSIKLFQEDFERDKLVTTPNIFVRDIFIQFVDQKDLSDSTYYLTILSPRGTLFTDNVTHLDLTGRLLYQGEDLINNRRTSCQWYIRDLSVMIGTEEYDKIAGPGWKKIDNTTFTLSIDESEVLHSQEYKLIAIYKDSIISSAEISIYNTHSPYDFILQQITEGDDVRVQIKNNIGEEMLGEWYINYSDATYTFISKGERQNSISISPYLKYSNITIYAQIYSNDNNLGVMSLNITNSEDESDVYISYEGQETFRYDANGDIDISYIEKEKTLQPILTWKEGVAASYYLTWSMTDDVGQEYTLPNSRDNAYSFINSMLCDLWVDNYGILHYNIRQKYKINSMNNIVALHIHTINGQVYTFYKEILFLKDGDQGTNGTTYIAAIRPCNKDGIKLTGFQPLIYQNEWKNRLDLRCYVYKDGELLNDDQLSFIWTGINILIDNETRLTTTNSQVNISGNSQLDSEVSSTLEFYVKAQVSISDNGKTITIYTSYPIDILVGQEDLSVIDISNIPSYIKYSSSGVNPQYYSSNISYNYKDIVYDSGISSLNTKILNIIEKDNKKYLNPVGTFTFDNIKQQNESNIGVLNINLPNSSVYIIHSIIMYLDNYGNEAINGWDGTALDTGNGEYVFAPQVGAGEKDSANRFTGVVMGKDSGQDLIGLYGYQKGTNTFGLMENGKAYFGAKNGGGQIVLDGTSGIIHGGDVTINSIGNIEPAENGMYMRLADRTPDKTLKAIGIGLSEHEDSSGRIVTEENFYVTYDGRVKATEADIQGNIYAVSGQIGGNARSGGWTIESGRIYSGSSSTYVALDSVDEIYAVWAGRADPQYAPFYVQRNGYVYANNVKVKGNIEADTLTANKNGSIAGWEISSTQLTAANGKVGIASVGNNMFWVNNYAEDGTAFSVTSGGQLKCKNAIIEGNITANRGTIGGWTLNNTGLSSGNLYIGSNGIFRLGSNFSIDQSGNVQMTGKVTATSGKIGDWNIVNGELSNNDRTVYLSTTGLKIGKKFSVDASGASITGKVEATSGKIGNWNISNGQLGNGNTTLTASGNIKTQQIEIYHNDGSSEVTLGRLGLINGSQGAIITDSIGIASNSNQSIIFLSSLNGRFSCDRDLYLNANRRINIDGSSISFNGTTLDSILSRISSLESRVSVLENSINNGGE